MLDNFGRHRQEQTGPNLALASITADHARASLSGKYSFVPTTTVVSLLEARGWRPTKAQQVRVKDETRDGFQKHLITFQRAELGSIIPAEVLYPQILLTNSHDGLASFCLTAGLFRLVCTNGLVVGDNLFEAMRVKHVGFDASQIFGAIEKICDELPRIGERVKQFREIELTQDERGVFAESAASIKYDEDALKKVSIQRLLSPARREDAAPTLWNTFNSVQEKLLKGGQFLEKERPGWINRRTGAPITKTSRARGVTSINENQRLNKALWSLAEKMAALKTGAAN